jgi:peptidoglycan/LPS O-acetylase OafA/YrhL
MTRSHSPSIARPLATPASSLSDTPIAPVLPVTAREGGATRKLEALTSLRFIAAGLIVIYHVRGFFGIPPTFLGPFAFSQGVSFFFVLSGFILTYVYPSLTGAGARHFLRARIARIWPAHIFTFLLLMLLLPAARHGQELGPSIVSPTVLGANILLIHSWIPDDKYQLFGNVVSWSVSTELGFYLLFPLLIHNLRRTWIVKLLGAFILLCMMMILANHRFAAIAIPISPNSLIYVNPLSRLFEFVVGMTAALAWQTYATKLRFSRYVATLLECLTVGLVILTMYYSASWTRLIAAHVGIGYAGTRWLNEGGASCLAFAALIFVMALGRGGVSRILSFPLPVLLGEISYSIYLVHQILLRYYYFHRASFANVPTGISFVIFFSLTLLAAYFTWATIELPCRRFLVRLGTTRSVSQADTANASAKAKPAFYMSTTWKRSLVAAVLIILLVVPVHSAVASTASASRSVTSAASGLRKVETPTLFSIDSVGELSLNGSPVLYITNLQAPPVSQPMPISITRASYPSGVVVVTGWAVDAPAQTEAKGVFLLLDGTLRIATTYGIDRTTALSDYLGNSRYQKSGYTGEIPLANLLPGHHDLSILIMRINGQEYLESPKVEIQVI